MHNKKILSKMALSMFLIGLMSTGVYADSSKSIDISGKDRYETSSKAADLVKSDTAVIASGQNYADSLSAYNIAASKHAKLILVNENTNVEKELKDKKIKNVFIVGGNSVISQELEKKVKSVVPNTKRIAGVNRYETNKLTLKESGFKSVGVADGRNFPDALSSTGLLMNKKLGLMLVDGSKPYTTEYKVEYTFGGKNSVMQDGGKRIAGASRYETSISIAKEMGKLDSVVVTTGKDFPDALGAVNLLNINITRVTPIIIVSDTLSPEAKTIISNVQEKYLLGGALGDSIKVEISGKTSVTVQSTGTSGGGGGGGSVSSGSSSSRHNSTKAKANPEVKEIIENYKKNSKDEDYYPGDSWSPKNVEKSIESQRIHSMRDITSNMSPEMARDQFMYNNFFAVNSDIRDIKASDLPRLYKAIDDYKKLPVAAKELAKSMYSYNLDSLGPNSEFKYNTAYLGTNVIYENHVHNYSLKNYEGISDYNKNTPIEFTPYHLRKILGNEINSSMMYALIKKIDIAERMNNRKLDPEEVAKGYRELYSNLPEIKNISDINNFKYNIFDAISDYKFLPEDAQKLLKNDYEKIHRKAIDQANSYNTPYSEKTKEQYSFESYFKTMLYKAENDNLRMLQYSDVREDSLGNGGKIVLNYPASKDRSDIGGKIYGSDGMIYRFKNIEYVTTNNTVRIKGEIKNITDKTISLNEKTPYAILRIDMEKSDNEIYYIMNISPEVKSISPNETVEVTYIANISTELMNETISNIKNQTIILDYNTPENRKKYNSLHDDSIIEFRDSNGALLVGGAFITGHMEGDEDNGNRTLDINGIYIDNKPLQEIANITFTTHEEQAAKEEQQNH